MILADTNVISTFARVGALPLLVRLMGESKRDLLRQIETEQGMVLKNQEAIFAERQPKDPQGRHRQ